MTVGILVVFSGGEFLNRKELIMLDFCFYYHSHVEFETQPDAQLGLGLLSLATHAKGCGANVCVINAQSKPVTKGIFNIPRCKYLMLYGCLIDRPMIHLITKYVQGRWPVGPPHVCIGGPIAKSLSISTKGVSILDGPGEDYIGQLTTANKAKEGYFKLPNLKHDINDYPWPNRKLIQGGYGGNIFKDGESTLSTTILTSRGCKFDCAFCSSGNNPFYQDYRLSRIEAEIEHCLSLGIKDIRISDDNLLGDRLVGLCRILKEAGIRWRGSIRTSPNHREMYEMMAESGCAELSFGIESGDQDVLNFLRKHTTLKKNYIAIQNARKAGILTRALMMMGTPGEKSDTVVKNIRWVLSAQPDYVSLKMFVPYPGTDIFDHPEKYNCTVNIQDANNSAYRPDGSEPIANIILKDSKHDPNKSFQQFKSYLEGLHKENRG